MDAFGVELVGPRKGLSILVTLDLREPLGHALPPDVQCRTLSARKWFLQLESWLAIIHTNYRHRFEGQRPKKPKHIAYTCQVPSRRGVFMLDSQFQAQLTHGLGIWGNDPEVQFNTAEHSRGNVSISCSAIHGLVLYRW